MILKPGTTQSYDQLQKHQRLQGLPVKPNRNFRVLRLLRFGRIVRVVRIVRVARLFRSLRTLINSLVGTLKSLFWSLLLLALIMYMFQSSNERLDSAIFLKSLFTLFF